MKILKEQCNVCKKEYSPRCDYRQGRCPHHPSLIGNIMNQPNPTKHLQISLIKSIFRIAAGLALAGGGWLEMNPYIQGAGLVLVLAEVLGIAEELV
jgi:hypothetical protein